jgi:hypothetical protein
MAGRPINESRQTAILCGDKTYIGATHARCGTYERYVSGGGCVHCARVIATEQREARKALLAGAGTITMTLDDYSEENVRAAFGSDDLFALDTDPTPQLELTSAERYAQSIEDDLM